MYHLNAKPISKTELTLVSKETRFKTWPNILRFLWICSY